MAERRGKECCRLKRGLRAESGHFSEDEEQSEGEFIIDDEGKDTEVSRKGFERVVAEVPGHLASSISVDIALIDSTG